MLRTFLSYGSYAQYTQLISILSCMQECLFLHPFLFSMDSDNLPSVLKNEWAEYAQYSYRYHTPIFHNMGSVIPPIPSQNKPLHLYLPLHFLPTNLFTLPTEIRYPGSAMVHILCGHINIYTLFHNNHKLPT